MKNLPGHSSGPDNSEEELLKDLDAFVRGQQGKPDETSASLDRMQVTQTILSIIQVLEQKQERLLREVNRQYANGSPTLEQRRESIKNGKHRLEELKQGLSAIQNSKKICRPAGPNDFCRNSRLSVGTYYFEYVDRHTKKQSATSRDTACNCDYCSERKGLAEKSIQQAIKSAEVLIEYAESDLKSNEEYLARAEANYDPIHKIERRLTEYHQRLDELIGLK